MSSLPMAVMAILLNIGWYKFHEFKYVSIMNHSEIVAMFTNLAISQTVAPLWKNVYHYFVNKNVITMVVVIICLLRKRVRYCL